MFLIALFAWTGDSSELFNLLCIFSIYFTLIYCLIQIGGHNLNLAGANWGPCWKGVARGIRGLLPQSTERKPNWGSRQCTGHKSIYFFWHGQKNCVLTFIHMFVASACVLYGCSSWELKKWTKEESRLSIALWIFWGLCALRHVEVLVKMLILDKKNKKNDEYFNRGSRKFVRRIKRFFFSNLTWFYQCWSGIVFFFTMWIYIMRISYFSDTSRVWVFLFSLPFRSIYHARTFTPMQNRPSINMV